jgi:quercetin dioxygenase-like cupin family protein
MKSKHILILAPVAAVLVWATPTTGITQVVLSLGLYDGINAAARLQPKDGDHGWRASLKVNGATDVAVNSNTAAPGASSGWHSHPGLSIVTVTQGAIWDYRAEDPNCKPRIITAGQGWVEPGNHVHLVRNEGAVEAKWTTTAIRPAGSQGRIDQPAPPHCAVY